MSNGVFAVLMAVCFFVAAKSGRALWMGIFAIAFAVVLASGNGPLSSTAKTLTTSTRTILTTIGGVIG
jgi:hypothetical protein